MVANERSKNPCSSRSRVKAQPERSGGREALAGATSTVANMRACTQGDVERRRSLNGAKPLARVACDTAHPS